MIFPVAGNGNGSQAPAATNNTLALGQVLYTDFVYAFEIAAFILLVAIVAAIALSQRRRSDAKYQDAAAQAKVRREDRLRIVSMPAVKAVVESAEAVQSPEGGEKKA